MKKQDVTVALPLEFSKVKKEKHEGQFVFGEDGDAYICATGDSLDNIAVIGPCGSGKTAGILLPNMLRSTMPVIAVDTGGNLYDCCKDKMQVVKFCLGFSNAETESCHVDLLAPIRNMGQLQRQPYIQKLSEILIPGDQNLKPCEFFQGVLQLLLSEDWRISFSSVIHEILYRDVAYWGGKATKSDCGTAKRLLTSFCMDGAADSTVLSALQEQLKGLSNPVLDKLLTCGEECFGIDELAQGESICLLVDPTQDWYERRNYGRILAAVIYSLHAGLRFHAPRMPVMTVLDEFANLSFPLWMVEWLFDAGRGMNIVTLQDYSQLEKYGRAEARRFFEAYFDYYVITGCCNISSAQTYSIMCRGGENMEKFPPEYFMGMDIRKQMVVSKYLNQCVCDRTPFTSEYVEMVSSGSKEDGACGFGSPDDGSCEQAIW